MSKRTGYWIAMADGTFDGPFKAVSEAKSFTGQIDGPVTIQAMVAFERRDETGKWKTVQ